MINVIKYNDINKILFESSIIIVKKLFDWTYRINILIVAVMIKIMLFNH